MIQDRLLLVPTRLGRGGTLVLTTACLATGERIGLAFTSIARLRGTLGVAQRWTTLPVATLRALLAASGVATLRVDPLPVTSPPAGPAGAPPATANGPHTREAAGDAYVP